MFTRLATQSSAIPIARRRQSARPQSLQLEFSVRRVRQNTDNIVASEPDRARRQFSAPAKLPIGVLRSTRVMLHRQHNRQQVRSRGETNVQRAWQHSRHQSRSRGEDNSPHPQSCQLAFSVRQVCQYTDNLVASEPDRVEKTILRARKVGNWRSPFDACDVTSAT